MTESAAAIGQAAARKEDLKKLILTNGDLYMDIGALKEILRSLEKELNIAKTASRPTEPSTIDICKLTNMQSK